MDSLSWHIFVFCSVSSFFLISSSCFNLSSLLDSGNNSLNGRSSLVLDHQAAGSQIVPLQDFLINPEAALGNVGDQQAASPSSDLKVWEAIPVIDYNSQLAQYLRPPSSDQTTNLKHHEQAISSSSNLQTQSSYPPSNLQNYGQTISPHIQAPSSYPLSNLQNYGQTIGNNLQTQSSYGLSNLQNYGQTIGANLQKPGGYDQISHIGNEYGMGAHLHEDGTSNWDYESPYSRPNLGSLLGEVKHGGFKNAFPRHKFRKNLRQFHHGGFFGKHRGFGYPFLEAGAYIGDLAYHLGNSFYHAHIPPFTPLPISIPHVGGADPYALEASIYKAILVPLAGVALLGAAATAMVVTNPFIWSLPFTLLLGPTSFGHLTHFFGRRRRRRDVDPGFNNYTLSSSNIKKKIEEIKILDGFLKQTSKAEVIIQEKKVLATYLMTQAICIDRLVCSLHRPKLPDNMAQEGRIMNIVTKEILENEFVPQIIHDNILRARQVGLASGNCQTFLCQPINYFAHHQR